MSGRFKYVYMGLWLTGVVVVALISCAAAY